MSQPEEIPESDKPFYLALILLVPFVFIVSYAVVARLDYAKDLITGLASFASAAIGFYFGAKNRS